MAYNTLRITLPDGDIWTFNGYSVGVYHLPDGQLLTVAYDSDGDQYVVQHIKPHSNNYIALVDADKVDRAVNQSIVGRMFKGDPQWVVYNQINKNRLTHQDVMYQLPKQVDRVIQDIIQDISNKTADL